ncbi:hypothetical protein OG394_34570 [Kribbella sp. NBC_01245]|uniref:hypothetical protein n=1 Tax=Kribbella sp. NBC_01245 TaxID=2903578 RepID=UPI002E2BD7BC|nr:hypothetical protein [Kribbella sp. NBC_01245]
MALIVLVGVVLVFVVPLVVAIAVVERGRRAFEARRAEALARFGWGYVQPDPWVTELASIAFGSSSGNPMSMVGGSFNGRPVGVMDFEYAVSTTDGQGNVTSSSQACHVVAVYLPAAMPWLRLTKESAMGRMRESDLQLESKAFNDAFRVETPDDRYASAILHPRMMELMLASTWLDWQLAGPTLISWNLGRWEGPETVARLSVLTRIADLIPPFVLRDYGHPLA